MPYCVLRVAAAKCALALQAETRINMFENGAYYTRFSQVLSTI